MDSPAIIVSIEHDIRAIVCSSREGGELCELATVFSLEHFNLEFLSVFKVVSCLLLFPLWSSCIWILVLADAAWVN